MSVVGGLSLYPVFAIVYAQSGDYIVAPKTHRVGKRVYERTESARSVYSARDKRIKAVRAVTRSPLPRYITLHVYPLFVVPKNIVYHLHEVAAGFGILVFVRKRKHTAYALEYIEGKQF